MMSMKKLITSINKKDLIIQTFRSGGKGGQHQNKTDSGVRTIHKDSGAVGESRTHRSQHQNKKEALRRLINSSKFKLWVNKIVYEDQIKQTIEEKVEDMCKEENLKIEVLDGEGKWNKYLG